MGQLDQTGKAGRITRDKEEKISDEVRELEEKVEQDPEETVRFGAGYGDVEEVAGTPASRRRPQRKPWTPRPF